jgi:DNA replication protein DnaC
MRRRRSSELPAVFKKPPQNINEMLEYLNLPQSLETYKNQLESAARENISYEEFLTRFLSSEVSAKFERQVNARVAQAKFPFIKTIEEFDFNHPSLIPKTKIMAAAELGFIENNEGLVFIASHGLGKTHLAIAIGYRAALAGVKTCFTKTVDMVNHLTAAQADHSLHKAMKLYTHPTLLIIDELGRLSIDQKQGEHIFNVIDARYERGSTIITTNRAFRDWGKTFQDTVCAKGIIDRLIHHSEVICIEGTSYRIKDRKSKSSSDSPDIQK